MKTLILAMVLLLASGVQVASAHYTGASHPTHGYAERQLCHNKEYVPGIGGNWFYRYTFIIDGVQWSDPILPDTICLHGAGGHSGRG